MDVYNQITVQNIQRFYNELKNTLVLDPFVDSRTRFHAVCLPFHYLTRKLGIEAVALRFGFTDMDMLNFFYQHKQNELRTYKTCALGWQLNNRNYCTGEVLEFITQAFTTEEIVENSDIIYQCFLITDFIKREDFMSYHLLRIQRNLEHHETKRAVICDICAFASDTLRGLTPSFDWGYILREKEAGNIHEVSQYGVAYGHFYPSI
jgi:hypothetical protein